MEQSEKNIEKREKERRSRKKKPAVKKENRGGN